MRECVCMFCSSLASKRDWATGKLLVTSGDIWWQLGLTAADSISVMMSEQVTTVNQLARPGFRKAFSGEALSRSDRSRLDPTSILLRSGPIWSDLCNYKESSRAIKSSLLAARAGGTFSPSLYLICPSSTRSTVSALRIAPQPVLRQMPRRIHRRFQSFNISSPTHRPTPSLDQDLYKFFQDSLMSFFFII